MWTLGPDVECGEGLGEDSSDVPLALGDSRAVWRLTGSEGWEDCASECGSLDPWQWDEDPCYEEDSDGASLTPLLPTGGELDLEQELGGSREGSGTDSEEEDVTITAPPS